MASAHLLSTKEFESRDIYRNIEAIYGFEVLPVFHSVLSNPLAVKDNRHYLVN